MTVLQASPNSIFVINEHIVTGEGVSFTHSPNTSGLFEKGIPDTIVIHFTAGSSLTSSVNVLTDPDSGVSAHFAVGRNGNIVQMLPTNKVAWHAGESHFEGRSGLNKYSIGIELDNAGQLKKVCDRFLVMTQGYLIECPSSEVASAVLQEATGAEREDVPIEQEIGDSHV